MNNTIGNFLFTPDYAYDMLHGNYNLLHAFWYRQ